MSAHYYGRQLLRMKRVSGESEWGTSTSETKAPGADLAGAVAGQVNHLAESASWLAA